MKIGIAHVAVTASAHIGGMGALNDRQSGRGLLREEQRLRAAPMALAAAVLGLIAGLYVIGVIVTWVRLGAARLPASLATTALGDLQLFGTGLQSTALTLTAFALLCALAYVTSAFRWDVNGQDWHDIVRKRGVGRARADSTAPERHAQQGGRHRAAQEPGSRGTSGPGPGLGAGRRSGPDHRRLQPDDDRRTDLADPGSRLSKPRSRPRGWLPWGAAPSSERGWCRSWLFISS